MSTAVVGTVVAATITGGVLYLAGASKIVTRLSWVEALLFGTLINAVDPVATLTCFNRLHVPPLLFNLVFGESVINNAVAIALYQTLHRWDVGTDLSMKQLLRVAANTSGMFVGSLLVSATITLCGAFLLKRKIFSSLHFFPSYEICLCLVFSLLTYYVADSLKLSGIVALFFSGTMTAHYHFNALSREARHAFTHLLHTLSFLCENVVYVFMGTSVIMIFRGTESRIRCCASGGRHRLAFHRSHPCGLLLRALLQYFPAIEDFQLLARVLRPYPSQVHERDVVCGASRIHCVRARQELELCWSLRFAPPTRGIYHSCGGAFHDNCGWRAYGPDTLKLRLTGHHSALRQSEPDVNSEASSSNEDRARALQRSTCHFMLRRNSRATEQPARPSSEGTEENQEVIVDEDPVFTSRPQFRDDDYSGDEGERDGDSPQQRKETLTGAFFRNWQAFDAAYMQPIFGGSQAPANPRAVDNDAADSRGQELDKTAASAV